MTRVIEFVISLLLVVALFVVIGLTLPSKRYFEYSTETNRPMSTVEDLLNGFTRFKDWNALTRRDPRIQLTPSGAERGKGAKLSYVSSDKAIGEGSWTIVESVPGEMIKYELDNNARGHDKTMTIRLERTGQRNQNVKITQEYRVDYGYDLIGRYAGLYASRNVGDDIKRSLDKLTTLLATIPKFDYSQHPNDFAIVDLPAANVLYVTTSAKRNNEEIALAMNNQIAWIKKVMDANGLVADGPLRIVTNEYTTAAYGFDVMQPVRKAGAGDSAAVEDEEGEEGEAAAPATAAPTGPLEILAVKLEGQVQYEQIAPRKVAMTEYVGAAPNLARVRDVLRAWAMVRGHDVTDRPYEEYLDPVAEMMNEDARYKVYWPLKN